MISGRQIRAARGLMGWDAATLAGKAEMTKETIYRIEAALVHPQEKTLARIRHVFDQHEVEFTEGDGVKIRQHQVRLFSGKDGYKQFLDHIYDVMKDGGKIRQFNFSYGNNLPYASAHRKRMGEIADLDVRALTHEGDSNLPDIYCQYKWLNKSNGILAPYYTYNDFIAQPISIKTDSLDIVSIHSKFLTEWHIEQFEALWDSAMPPTKARGG